MSYTTKNNCNFCNSFAAKISRTLTLIFITICAALQAQTFDFKSLTPGDVLANQLAPDIIFVPYETSIKGTIESTPLGNVAQFHLCSGCEFFPSGAHALFSGLKQSVTIHLGLAPIGAPLQLMVRINGFDAAGNVVASTDQNITAGSGFNNEMTISSAAGNIASIIVQTTNDFAANGIITFSDIKLIAGSTAPDFLLKGVSEIDMIAGDYQPEPLEIIRLGGSTGQIKFTITGLPSGVVFRFNPNPIADGALIGFEFSPSTNVTPGIYPLIITGQPLTASAGPGPRTYTLTLKIARAFTIFATQNLDLSICKPGGPTGTVTVPVTVRRAGTVAGPVTLSMEGLPPDVKAIFNPAVLTFPGNVTGETSTLTITTAAGIDVGDVLVQIHASNGKYETTHFADLHGICSRENKDFTIKGFFLSNHKGFVRPIEGAVVEIYRDVTAWFDDKVGSTTLKADGSFELGLWANNEDAYYAKLQLNDEQGVYLHEGYNSGSWEANSVNRGSNKNPVIDLGTTLLTKDDGSGTPKASIWQGAHNAYQEYLKGSGNQKPVGGDYEIRIWYGIYNNVTTKLTSTDWPDGHQTMFTNGSPKGLDDFVDYPINFHEFGHTIRGGLDGDLTHLDNDYINYYINYDEHTFCQTTNDAFAFSEGWAQFWSKEFNIFNTCTADGINFNVEGNVANDLNNLMTCFHKSRNDMVKVLAQRTDFIHSDAEYRAAFQTLFSVDLSTCPPFKNIRTTSAVIPRPEILYKRIPFKIMTERLQRDVTDRAAAIREHEVKYKTAIAKSAALDTTSNKVDEQTSFALIEPLRLKTELELMRLLQGVFQQQLRTLKMGDTLPTKNIRVFDDSIKVSTFEFQKHATSIAIENISAAVKKLNPIASTVAGKTIIAQLNRTLLQLQSNSGRGVDVFKLFEIPVSYSDDTTSEYSKGINWWIWIAAILVIALLIFWLFRKRAA